MVKGTITSYTEGKIDEPDEPRKVSRSGLEGIATVLVNKFRKTYESSMYTEWSDQWATALGEYVKALSRQDKDRIVRNYFPND